MSGYLALLVIPWALAGGWWYRVRGGGGGLPDVPRIVRLVVWALLLTIPLWFIAPWWAALVGVAAVTVATSLGHGDFLDFSRGGRGDPDELLAPLADWVTGQRAGFRHDMVGMGLSGILMTFGPAVVASYFAGPLWLVWAPLGALKGLAYAIGYRFAAPEIGIEPTVVGEWLTGIFLCGATGLLWWASGS